MTLQAIHNSGHSSSTSTTVHPANGISYWKSCRQLKFASVERIPRSYLHFPHEYTLWDMFPGEVLRRFFPSRQCFSNTKNVNGYILGTTKGSLQPFRYQFLPVQSPKGLIFSSLTQPECHVVQPNYKDKVSTLNFCQEWNSPGTMSKLCTNTPWLSQNKHIAKGSWKPECFYFSFKDIRCCTVDTILQTQRKPHQDKSKTKYPAAPLVRCRCIVCPQSVPIDRRYLKSIHLWLPLMTVPIQHQVPGVWC